MGAAGSEGSEEMIGVLIDHFFGAKLGVIFNIRNGRKVEIGLALYQYAIIAFIIWLLFG